MAILWLFHTVMVFLLYDDLPSVLEDTSIADNNDNTSSENTQTEIDYNSKTTINDQSDNYEKLLNESEDNSISNVHLFKGLLEKETTEQVF